MLINYSGDTGNKKLYRRLCSSSPSVRLWMVVVEVVDAVDATTNYYWLFCVCSRLRVCVCSVFYTTRTLQTLVFRHGTLYFNYNCRVLLYCVLIKYWQPHSARFAQSCTAECLPLFTFHYVFIETHFPQAVVSRHMHFSLLNIFTRIAVSRVWVSAHNEPR